VGDAGDNGDVLWCDVGGGDDVDDGVGWIEGDSGVDGNGDDVGLGWIEEGGRGDGDADEDNRRRIEEGGEGGDDDDDGLGWIERDGGVDGNDDDDFGVGWRRRRLAKSETASWQEAKIGRDGTEMVNGTNYNNCRWHKIISIMVKSKKGKVLPSLNQRKSKAA